MPNQLEGKTIALGVSGSIACHKAVDLASKLTQHGAAVDVVMTEAATKLRVAARLRQHHPSPGRNRHIRPAHRACV